MLKTLMKSHPGLRLAVAESLTAGNLQARIASVSGASDYFNGGVTAYTIDLKVSLLGVNRAAAEACDAVSAEVARQMARGVCALMKCALGVATTGYAEPDRMKGVLAARAHWAVCHVSGHGEPVFIDGFAEFPGLNRTAVQARVSESALGTLEKYLATLKPAR